MATIKIADIEKLWSELSDKEAAMLSGGQCPGGGYPVYDPDLDRRVCSDYEDGRVKVGVGFPTVPPQWYWGLID